MAHLARQAGRRCFTRAVRHQATSASGAQPAAAGVNVNSLPFSKGAEKQYVTVHFVDPNVIGPPIRKTLRAQVGLSIVDVAKANGIDIHAACGQKLQCATCHVILKPAYYSKLQQPGVREGDLLDSTFTLKPTSRLGCQVLLTPDLDGIECMLPDSGAKGSVRMSMEQSRVRVEKQWTTVSAQAARPSEIKAEAEANNAAVAAQQELESMRQQLDDQRALAAHLESEIRQLRVNSGKSLLRDPATPGESASARMKEAASKADKVASASKDSSGDDGEEGLGKLKKELESTRVDVEALGRRVTFDDVVGLVLAKQALREAVLWPAVADAALFQGLRGSPKGLLLYGPPGCGKTMLARAAAAELGNKAAFFHVRPGDVMSKFYGDSQRRVLALEELVKESSPAVVFLDEVDSLLGSRDGDRVAEHHRATVNALLAWMDGFGTGDERIFFLGATNRPEAIDEAALRRFGEAAEIERPTLEARIGLLHRLVQEKAPEEGHLARVTAAELQAVAERTEGYSFADLDALTRRAFFEVLRRLPEGVSAGLRPGDVPSVTMEHFEAALGNSKGTSALREMLKKRGTERAQL